MSIRRLTALLTVVVTAVSGRGVPFPVPNQSPLESKGLYKDAPLVISMNGESLPSHIYDKDHATYLEFYNSYCGFCKKFAPHWKALSEELHLWRDIVQLGAIDCSQDENSDVCREFEVLAYPTVRYIPPKYTSGEKRLGHKVANPNHELMKAALIDFLLSEPNKQPHWPDFTEFDGTTVRDLFQTAAADVQLAILVVDSAEAEHNTTGFELIMDLHSVKQVLVRRTSTTLDFLPPNSHAKPWILAAFRNQDVLNNILLQVRDPVTKEKIMTRVINYLSLHSINVASFSSGSSTVNYPLAVTGVETNIDAEMEREQQLKLKEMVKKMPGTVFRADLEMALRYALFHEIPHFREIKDDRLAALKQFISLVARYFPFGTNGQRFIREIEDFVMNKDEMVDGAAFAEQVKAAEAKYRPVFSANRWVGCYSDRETLRRFPCGLWTMFHHLTVQAEAVESATDPLETLQAMHGYIKYFFGCTDCSQHFQAMAKRNKMWSVSSKDNAILWLWLAHNEVNNRLHGDETEDLEFPKIQFPSRAMCPECYKTSGSPFTNDSEIDWDKTEVLFYLKRIHSPKNVNILGVNNEIALPSTAEKMTAAGGNFGKIFTDLDFRMGVLLYVFCIAMLVIAVKLFVKRHGYRKKMYVHDLLGKV